MRKEADKYEMNAYNEHLRYAATWSSLQKVRKGLEVFCYCSMVICLYLERADWLTGYCDCLQVAHTGQKKNKK
jgi:hypothetical protein